jgi:hypothetical protein
MKKIRIPVRLKWAILQVKIILYYLFRKTTIEQKRVIHYLLRNKINLYPYYFTKKYYSQDIDLIYDDAKSMFYYIYDAKKMYFPSDKPKVQIINYIKINLAEQDSSSPHCYLQEDFNVSQNDIVLDIGGAEGNFALNIIDKVSKIYIFEPDKNWQKALKFTFEPWKDKVHIIDKFVGNKEENDCITIDSLGLSHVDFIKVDIEGAELDFLKGARQTLKRNLNLKISICTYHKPDDAIVIKKYLEKIGYSGNFSEGYMICLWDENLRKPYLRKGIFRANNNQY